MMPQKTAFGCAYLVNRRAPIERPPSTADTAPWRIPLPWALSVGMTPVELISPAAAVVEAILNHKEEALALINRATEIAPEGPHWGVELSWARTEVDALVGEKDRAISEIARLLRIPSWYSVHELKGNPAYASRRDDPRFAALPNDPLNNAPLF